VRAIVLPVKPLTRAKSRLEPVLAPLERAALTLAMLEDVLDAALPLPGWETWVVSGDEAVLEVAARRGARPLPERTPTLAAAIHQAEEEAAAAGASALAVLLPDTPLVTPAALARALHTLGPVVLTPAADEVGTNLLVRRPPDAIPSSFGPDSYRQHLQAAAERDLPISVVDAPELAFDVDLPRDILAVLASPRRTRTRSVAEEAGLAARIRATVRC
jgi:2-phospho-L-lactate guanylyltransferase